MKSTNMKVYERGRGIDRVKQKKSLITTITLNLRIIRTLSEAYARKILRICISGNFATGKLTNYGIEEVLSFPYNCGGRLKPLLYNGNICMQENFAKFMEISCTQTFPVSLNQPKGNILGRKIIYWFDQ